jgi:phospholipid/cholesterol/gamma-HCH transport system permease protein
MFTFVGDFTLFAIPATREAIRSAVARPGLVLTQLYTVFVGAIPLGIVAGVVLGAVIYMHTLSVLSRSGTTDFLPTALAAAVLLELAPIGAGLIVAARTGASLGAEIASLKQTEQLDALTMLGLSPFREVIGPRILATIIALPLLHILIAFLALASGYIADVVAANGTWLRYQDSALKELYLHEVIPAGLKTIIFGWLIGLAGCFSGMRADGGTEGVGRAATQGVVLACLSVFIADILLVAMIQIFLGPF